MADFKAQLNQINEKINSFFTFIGNKLKNFKNLSIGEQISYPSIGLGTLLILTSLILFII
jgi:hypothetical protein